VVLRYTFTAPGVASRQGERLVFDGMFHTEAARTWAETGLRANGSLPSPRSLRGVFARPHPRPRPHEWGQGVRIHL
jgi:hypothetical protein